MLRFVSGIAIDEAGLLQGRRLKSIRFTHEGGVGEI
jgi:hypothetical protein